MRRSIWIGGLVLGVSMGVRSATLGDPTAKKTEEKPSVKKVPSPAPAKRTLGAGLGSSGVSTSAAPKASAPTVAPKRPDLPPPPPTTHVPGEGTTGENLGSLEVSGQAKDRVNIEKVTPQIKVEVKELVDSVTDKTEKLLEQARPVPSEEDFRRYDRIDSPLTARPWLPDLVEPPIISFQPAPAQTTVVAWRLEVTDDKGDVVHIIAGKGNPVDEIVWDGFNSAKKMIRVGSAYSFRFITVDEFKDTHTTLGKAFTLRHLKYRDKKNLIVELSTSWLFMDDRVNPDAQPILDRAIDVLREYSSYPFAVEFQTRDYDGEVVKSRQKRITEKIAADLLIPVDGIRYTYAPIQDRGDVLRFVIRLR